MKLFLQSQECLSQILQFDKEIKEDFYILPFATVELAMIAQDQGDSQTAITFLENAK